MHGLALQFCEIEAIAASVKASPPFANVLICLPATLIARAVQTAGGRIAIGGEDCSAEIAGAFTGDISAEMLKDAGASAVHHRTFGTPPTSWRDRRHRGGEGKGRAARGTSGDHLHRRDGIAAAGRHRLPAASPTA